MTSQVSLFGFALAANQSFCKNRDNKTGATSIMKRYSSFKLAFALPLSVLTVWAAFAPLTRKAAAFEGDAYAIKGGTVVTVTGATIQKGTVIIRNGLIEA